MSTPLTASLLGLALTAAVCSSGLAQQRDYQSYDQLTARLKHLTNKYSKLSSLTTIGKTATGKEVWLLTLGRDNAVNKPAIVIAAGVEGTQLATTELSMQMTEQMLEAAMIQDSVRELLQKKTFYIFPNLTPDASEQYHEALRWERAANAQPTDDDRDGRMFEDAFEDLNKDGQITMMRVKSPNGLYRPSLEDPRVMVKADTTKGEKGGYLLLTEGNDNDKDGKWNEDAEGGVVFNRNFSYDFPYFQVGAGEHPISERETKAFADFMFEAKNVYAVFVFGPANTLSFSTPLSAAKTAAENLTGPLPKEASLQEKVSGLYNQTTQLQNPPRVAPSPGDVVQWAYFHYGRFSYSTPGWWVPKVAASLDSAGAEASFSSEENQEDLNFLRWARANDIPGVFVNWQPMAHPDFPGELVEVGGLAPYVKQTPPLRFLAPVAEKHFQFFSAYAKWMPTLKIEKVQTEKVAGGHTRITATVSNVGALPTHSEIGDQSKWVQKIRASLKLQEGHTLISGNLVQPTHALAPGQKAQFSWVVEGKGYITLTVGSPAVGQQTKEVYLY
ncbi:hypothetical protein TH63_07680 [Rufibacter radiotolerans]|uniref:Peptidase M14 domain-containing protein n=1 Tax=Rufibacter radiotolerans TaxID=1379910 RepID=A0A0H4VJL5_9BACT|nr:M14 family metallopeptidase [Rufibacter radiotolerans]AKQ45553.1 hypothetical protein TH63_07680 [Rufibacter radiotolerans]